MKIPFDIKYRQQIESGEYKVETRDGVRVKLLPINSHNARPIIGELELNEKTVYISTDENGSWTEGNGESQFDLFIITPEPELSEFENKLRVICEDAVKESQLFPERTSEDFAKKHSAELLVLARKELEQEWPSIIQAQSFNAGLKQGKVEALKDLPRWRKWGNGACGNGRGIPIAIVKRRLNGYELVDALGISGEQYIMLSDLEKLPGFKEDSHE